MKGVIKMGKIKITLSFDTDDEKSRDSISLVDILAMKELNAGLVNSMKETLTEIKTNDPNTECLFPEIEVDCGYALIDWMDSHGLLRQYYCLKKAGINTIWELFDMKSEDIIAIPGIGVTGSTRLLTAMAKTHMCTVAKVFEDGCIKGGNNNDNA